MDLIFWFFAFMAVSAGLLTITAKDPLPCALSLMSVFIAFSGLYLHLHAPLMAIFQVTIYAGAILVLVLFVMMLLTTPGERLKSIQKNVPFRIMGAQLGLCLTALLGFGMKGISDLVVQARLPDGFGHPSSFGTLFFKDYLLHFEVASVLLLVALVGSIYLGKKSL
ncbi:MAG TPA: hypothetical protein EYP57_09405 [Thermodesulfobacteriaceae bacterium]|nr:hypothetical protein [Thermodesulfobacteriaceae bacterium]